MSSQRLNGFSRRKPESGFTLVELLVVLGVFVILVSLTVPGYIATRPQRMLSSETNRFAAQIRQGRLFSLRDNAKVYMEFLPEIDMYRLWTSQGWQAYADPVNGPNDPIGRNPEIGDYDGDLDGDGDSWWGDGPDSEDSNTVPEDPDVIWDDVNLAWVYIDTDGTYLDPDVLLMPTYPGNQPIRTLSPKLRISLDSDGDITNITRDFSDTGGVGGDNIVPFEVDLRLISQSWGDGTQPLGKRNGVLSHFPLMFIVFFPDGTVCASWDVADSNDHSDEIIDLSPGRLGATQLRMQARTEDYNPESFNLYNPTLVVQGDEGPNEPISAYTTLSLEDSNSDSYGKVITLNNLSGRLVIRNYVVSELDKLDQDFGIKFY